MTTQCAVHPLSLRWQGLKLAILAPLVSQVLGPPRDAACAEPSRVSDLFSLVRDSARTCRSILSLTVQVDDPWTLCEKWGGEEG